MKRNVVADRAALGVLKGVVPMSSLGTWAGKAAADFDRLVTVAAKYADVPPECILKQAEIMTDAGLFSTVGLSVEAILDCLKGNRMTPLEIAAKAYEKYREVLSPAVAIPLWDELNPMAQVAFLSFSEESNRLYAAQHTSPTMEELSKQINGTADEIPF